MKQLYSTYRKWNGLGLKAEKGIIVGADTTQQWILPWWWHHYHQFNEYPVTFVDLGMSEDVRVWCQKRGHVIRLPVADIYVADKKEIGASFAQEWENTYGRDFWIQRNGWFKKPLACLLSPYAIAIWIDLDCEIRGSLHELFSYGEHPPGISLAKDIHDPLAEQRGYNSGVIIFKRGISLVEKWADEAFESNHLYAGDQDILSKIIFDQNIPITELPLIYNWSRCSGDNPEARIFHWHGRHGKTVIAASPYLEFTE